MSPERGLFDTSAVIGIEGIEAERLPASIAISTLTLAELSSGPASTDDDRERAFRLERLQRAEATFEALDFDSVCARAYGRIYAAVVAVGRKPRGPRTVDLMIAATALAGDLPLYTLNDADLHGLDGLVEIVDLGDSG